MSQPSTSPLPPQETLLVVRSKWQDDVLPSLSRYIEIPAKSPAFDADWAAHGHIDRAVHLIEEWGRRRPIEGLTVETFRLPGRTPVMLLDVPGTGPETILLYGHCDKQPEMVGWNDGLGPWTAVRRGDRLYGRGAQDDGYAVFCALTAIEAVERARVPHARCLVLIEASEESGSVDLPAYMESLAGRLGEPDLVICLDSGCGNYDQLWGTTSLRGILNGVLTIEILTEGVHSGGAGGIVPSTFRIARQLLSRLEDERTAAILPSDFRVDIPRERVEQARAVAAALGDDVWKKLPFVPTASPAHLDAAELLLNNTWRPVLEVTGAAGLPAPADAGNVLRPFTTLKLSLRLPPKIDAAVAAKRLKELLEADPPHGARVTFDAESSSSGWEAPAMSEWLQRS